jgi:uncharacterized protein
MNRAACALWILGLLCLPVPASGQAAGAPTPQAAGLLPAAIPIFPLEDVVLFPNISRPLLIFEPRYRAMVADALKGDRVIGMVLLRPGYEADYEGRPPVYSIGCAGVITQSQQLPDGRYVILLRGLVKFVINGEDQSRAYRLARVDAVPETLSDEDRATLRDRRQQLTTLLAAALGPGADLPPPSLPDEELVNLVAQNLDLDPGDRQELLEQKGPLARSDGIIRLLQPAVSPRR